MMSWHWNIWKVKIWLSQERKELFSKWNKKTFFLVSKMLSFGHTKQTSKNVAEKILKEHCFLPFKHQLVAIHNHCKLTLWSGLWISNWVISCLKPLNDSMIGSALHSFIVDRMSNKYSWKLVVKSNLSISL